MSWLTLMLALAFASAVSARDLPDFTELVEDNAPAVVNISTVQKSRSSSRQGRQGRPGNEELEEFFRRFFPPGRGGPGRGAPEGDSPFRSPQSLGSGFILSRDGYVLTNNHVVDGAEEIVVRLSDRRELTAELVGADPRSDLALLKIEARNLPTVKLGKSKPLKVGAWVLAIGSPFGFDYSVTAGIVSAKGRSLPTARNENYVPYIQTDVAINPGNSGGPLFNLDGEVVGINSQIYSNSGGFMGVSFAIPIDVAMEVVDQLKSNGKVSRGWLGVVIQEVNRDLAESFGLKRPQGALVARVLDDSPAEKAGLQEGDVIIAFNGEPIDLSSELPHLVGRVPAGSTAKLRVQRGGKAINLNVKIGELAGGSEELAGRGRAAPDQNDSALGLAIEALPAAQQEKLGISGGVRVLSVDGPAVAAGLRAGDIITRINNQAIDSPAVFTKVTKGLPRGRSVPVLIIRGEVPTFLAFRVPD
ncbi:MAG: DegQ family serine endoprotease [Pseudomonadales bacterium]